MNKTDNKTLKTIDNKSGRLMPTPKKIDLKSMDDVRLEMATVYRLMRNGQIETSDGTKQIYVLGTIGKIIETVRIEERLIAQEKVTEGKINEPFPEIPMDPNEASRAYMRMIHGD